MTYLFRRPWWRVGWRNLGRNRRRTLFTASGLAIGYCTVVVMTGLGRGMVAEMVGNGTGILSGQLQLHGPDYLPERSMYETIGGREGADVEALVARVEADPSIAAAGPRVYGGGLVSSGDATVAASLIGIDPAREPHVSRIPGTVYQGAQPTVGTNELLIGREMATQLDVGPGDEIVLVAPASDGSLGNDLFRVSGVFSTGLTELDGAVALLPLDALQQLIALPADRVHEIAARVEDPWAAAAAAERIDAWLGTAADGARATAWTELQPEMVFYARLFESMEWILLVIIFVMAVFGVANTMLTGTYERRREFAVILALGAGPGLILRSVLAEAIALGVLSLGAGALITGPLLFWWHEAPPDMSWLYGGFTMAGGLVRPVLRVEYPPEMLWMAAVALFVTAVLAAIYPAYRGARTPPADTLAGR
jgi:ABC-type lipoprotein release transport system permease subunit